MDVSALPTLNASLNATSALLIGLGWVFARQRAITAHTICMLGATLVSSLFLISYLTYHALHGSTRFQGTGWTRWLYFGILGTHTVLAIVVVPLVIVTLRRAFAGRFDKHTAIGRITMPIWLYVSVTGVVVYWMLYKL